MRMLAVIMPTRVNFVASDLVIVPCRDLTEASMSMTIANPSIVDDRNEKSLYVANQTLCPLVG